jgi:hypothetical protein
VALLVPITTTISQQVAVRLHRPWLPVARRMFSLFKNLVMLIQKQRLRPTRSPAFQMMNCPYLMMFSQTLKPTKLK